jgi:hypothetical protein
MDGSGGPGMLDGYWGGLPGTAASEIAQAPRCTQQPCMATGIIAASPHRRNALCPLLQCAVCRVLLSGGWLAWPHR